MKGVLKMELVEIAYFPSYIINTKGIVLDKETLEKIKPNKNKKLCLVNYQGNIEFNSTEELLVLTFIGSMPCKIIKSHNKGKIEFTYMIDSLELNGDKIIINNIEFRKINESDYLYISNNGVVYSNKAKRFAVKKFVNGYPAITVKCNGKERIRLIHRLVYETWVEKIADGFTINHKDGFKWNSFVENLEMITNSDNIRHAVVNKLNSSKYFDIVDDVCILMAKGLNSKEIACELKFESPDDIKSISNLCSRIRCGYYYKDIANKYDVSKSKTIRGSHGINTELLDKIGNLINKGFSNNRIAKDLNISESFIRGIKIGKFHSEYMKKYNLSNENSIYLRNNSCSKLTDNQVRNICKLLIKGELTQYQIGKIFGVSEDIVSNIKNKRTYRNITNDYF